MSEFVVDNVRVVRPGMGIGVAHVRVADGSIVEYGQGPAPEAMEGIRIDGQGRLLTPGLIDLHSHGIHDFCFELGPEHLLGAASVLGRYGTTSIVPTLAPKSIAGFIRELASFAEVRSDISGVYVPGLHLEGPFLALAGAGCATLRGDVVLLDELLDACEGWVSVMSVAPEVPDIVAVIERLVSRGVVPFITHTRAGVEDTLKAMDAGATHATHFYDVFPAPDETDPGVRPVGAVETVLGDVRATCDFIADGIHVHPMAIRAAVAAKGWQGVSLITDASFGAGLPPGEYATPWGFPVRVRANDAPRIAAPDHPLNGALAGSALTMNVGLSNLLNWLDLPPEQVWAMATRNPAALIGMRGKGLVEPGADADLVLWDEVDQRLVPARTWVAGETVYTRG